MISLANGTQTMAKGSGLACPFPFLPLNYVLYGPDSPFNLISICKLIRDLHCSITFFNSSVTLQDRSTGNTIGIEYESQARLKISVLTDISVLRFYGYIGYSGGYFYTNIDISKINKSTLKFMKIPCQSVKMTLIIKYTHCNDIGEFVHENEYVTYN